MLRLLVLFLIVAQVLAQCSKEFESCVMNRDCCADDALHCAVGDWAVTTDSTCLSNRSEQLNILEMDKKVLLIQRYYEKLNDANKTPEQAEALAKKYSNMRQFAQLVVRLERKYEVSVDYENSSNGKKEEL